MTGQPEETVPGPWDHDREADRLDVRQDQYDRWVAAGRPG